MPSPQETVEGTVRALSAEMTAGALLEAVQTIIADDPDTPGYNRGVMTPAVILQVSSLVRRSLDQSWTGEWEYGIDADGNEIQGRVFLKGWRLTLSARVITGTVQGRDDPTAGRRALVGRLGTVLSKYDTELGHRFLMDDDGNPLQNISVFRDEGGEPFGSSTSARQFDREIAVEFEQRVHELQWGGTPVITTVISPIPGEIYGDPELTGGVKGIPDADRVSRLS